MIPNRRPLIAAGVALGVGLGGFIDGILFHQLLQVHNMFSAPGYYPKTGVPPDVAVVNLEINMFWDGMFHAFTWGMTALGLGLLWNAARRPDVPHSTRTLVGACLLGFGLFNLVEGLVDHHILHLHHVVEGPNHLLFDLAFLASGVVLMALGGGLIHRGRRDPLRAAAV